MSDDPKGQMRRIVHSLRAKPVLVSQNVLREKWSNTLLLRENIHPHDNWPITMFRYVAGVVKTAQCRSLHHDILSYAVGDAIGRI